jgi:hypothetical protein
VKKINFNDGVSVSAEITLSEKDFQLLHEYVCSLGFKDLKTIYKIRITRQYTFTNSNFDIFSIIYSTKFNALKKGASKYQEIKFENDLDSHWKKIITFISRNLIPRILYYPNFLFDFPDKIYIDENEDDTLEHEKYKDVIQDILSSIDNKLMIKDHLLDRLTNVTPSNKEALEHTLAKMSTKVSNVVFAAWAKLFNSVGKEIIIRSDSEAKPDGTLRYYLEFKLKEGSTQYYIAERSLGFKWFFSFLLFTEFRKNRITDSGELLFLLDEPASNLHSTAQKNLLKTFEELIDKSTLIYTTHSHHLINPEWLNGAYIVRNKALNYSDELNYDSTKTDVEAILYKQFVAKYPDHKDYYQPILDTLEYQPGLLEKIPSIVITEGKNDYFTLNYICKIYFIDKFKELNFYPGAGADANYSVIRLYLAWGRDFRILLDGDKAGLKAEKSYHSTFGAEVQNNIISFATIHDSFYGFSMEDMFSTDEKLIITKLFDPALVKYEKGKFNTSIQNLLIQNEKLDLSSDTLDRFDLIFTFLAKSFNQQ